MQRLLIEKIENRILVGIVMFTGIMIMVGWVAINENARMASFERMYLARSVERGAELFAANCTSCHGTDGRGITGRAPALNSPHFFGFDFAADQKRTIVTLERERGGLEAEQLELATQLPNATSAQAEEITVRLDEIAVRLGPDGIDTEIAQAEEEMAQIMAQLQPATLVGYPDAETLEANPAFVTRLGQAGWENTLESYIFTTLVHGRAQNRFLWGENVMVAWAQSGGGPFRDDQVQDVVNFILNWDKGDEWAIADALAVQQYAQVPGFGGSGEAVEGAEPVGTDVDAILTRIEEEGITGDAARGENIYNSLEPSQLGQILGCSGCHQGGAAAPATDLTWQAFQDERSQLDQFADYTFEQYMVESIVLPNEYIVAPYGPGVMPQNFGERMTHQDIADVIAYVASYGNE